MVYIVKGELHLLVLLPILELGLNLNFILKWH